MKINKILITLFSIVGLLISLNETVKAAVPLPSSSLPLDNVFSVPTGANSYIEGNSVVITTDQRTQIGSVFSTEGNKLDLNQSFHAEMHLYLGDKRNLAADGMTFVMHNDKIRANKFTGGTGEQLGVFAKIGSGGSSGLQEQIEKSFVVEFDTYINSNSMDTQVDKNADKGHIAYAFPELMSSYNTRGNIVSSLVHQGLYYPSDYLSNGKWHLFSVDWDATKKVLVYKFDDAPEVSVPITPSAIFGTSLVYWGFTGSTGSLSQESRVAFKQIPGLVNISPSMKVTKDGKDIENTQILSGDGDIKVQYDLKYNGGKQNLLNPIFNLDLDEFLSFKPGTLTVNDTTVSDEYFVNGKLKYNLTDMSTTNNSVRISFEATPKVVTDKDTQTTINYSLNAENYFGNNLKAGFSIKKVNIITSSYFENQSWLINEINRQLSPKKIDVDVYDRDLAQITNIDLNSVPHAIGEYIPKKIDSLINLNYIRLANQKLIGVLPEELGNLSRLTYLSIYGNAFDSEIPKSIGKLQELTVLALSDNKLKGTIPVALASLPKLSQIYLDENKLTGQLPDLPINMMHIDVKDNQLTYNLSTVPSFLSSAKTKDYAKTFIEGLKLTGNARIVSESENIKPFDELNTGYFDLKVMQGEQSINLYDEHIYIIKNTFDGTVYYKGEKNSDVTVPYKKGISYTVILDEAEKNPNNVFIVSGEERELKFAEIPLSINLKIKLGAEKQDLIPEGNLAIFDNRENQKWKLSVTLNELTQGQKKLQGEFNYTNKSGVSYPIATGQKFILETGESDSVNEVIQVSNTLGTNYGLSYTAYRSNHIGNYQGNIIWTLEDAP